VLDKLFYGLFETGELSSIGVGDFLACLAVSLAVGALLAAAFTYKNTYTKGFVITLAMLPAVVTLVIMMVSGNIGAGVAVAGTFSLVRFRSVPGTAREICAIFLAMASGLATGMGYVAFAVLFALIMAAAGMLYTGSRMGEGKAQPLRRNLHITIPESLSYTDAFEELFKTYTTEHKLISVKTTNLGTLFKLSYDVTLKNAESEKAFIDALRCRNGNLEISSAQQTAVQPEL